MRAADRGQATVDYLAVVLVAALAMTAAGAVWSDPEKLGGSVSRALARALCLVGGGFCDADLKPCVTAKDTDARHWHVSVVFARFGKDDVLVREQRSDGTVALTRTKTTEGGLDHGWGAKGSVGGRGFDLSADLQVLDREGKGAVYVARDAAEADRLQARIVAGDGDLPRPAFTLGSSRVQAELSAKLDLPKLTGELAVRPAAEEGMKRDLATGRTTIYLEGGLGGGASLVAGRRGASGTAEVAERYAVVLDETGRARELVVTARGRLTGAGDLPGIVAPMDGRLRASAQAGAGVEWSTESHLDLDDVATARTVDAFVEELRHPQLYDTLTGRPSDAVRAAIEQRGTIEARTYAVREVKGGVEGSVGAVAKLGGARERTTTTARLLAAVSRGPDGAWRMRGDCVADHARA